LSTQILNIYVMETASYTESSVLHEALPAETETIEAEALAFETEAFENFPDARPRPLTLMTLYCMFLCRATVCVSNAVCSCTI